MTKEEEVLRELAEHFGIYPIATAEAIADAIVKKVERLEDELLDARRELSRKGEPV